VEKLRHRSVQVEAEDGVLEAARVPIVDPELKGILSGARE
jgi:hypothetical protein